MLGLPKRLFGLSKSIKDMNYNLPLRGKLMASSEFDPNKLYGSI